MGDHGDVVGGCPVLGHVFLTKIELACFERLHRDRDVAVIVIAEAVEIILTGAHGELGPPVVLDAPVGDGAARIDRLDAVRAATEGRLQGRLLEIALAPGRLGKDGELADDQGQLAVLPGTEGELDLAIARPLGLHHLGVVATEERLALALQGLEGPDHVVDGDGCAVVKPRLGAQGEGYPRPVGRNLDALGQQPILRERLVQRADHEGLEDAAQPDRRHSLHDEGVERVEGPDGGELDVSTLGGLGVGVLEVLEARGVLEVAVHRDGVGRGDLAAGGLGF